MEKKGRKILDVFMRNPSQELTRAEMAERLGVQQKAIDKAVDVLKKGTLLFDRKEKINTPPFRKTFYRLNPHKIDKIQRLVEEDQQ